MDNIFKFEEEIDESAIAIELKHIKIKNSIFYLFTKRVIDFIGALVGLILLSPIMLIVAIAIKLEDPKGKVIFGHMRVGKDGNMFPCLKFRVNVC